MKIKIKVMSATKTKGQVLDFIIEGEVKENGLTPHDLSARLFAMEFAINNYSEIPMRVHIEEV